jgi:hypothetical protein
MRTLLRTTATAHAADWLAYFTHNRAHRMPIPWERGIHVSFFLQKPLIHSLQRFQIGESGDGKHLKQHAARTGDPAYTAAVELFIAEEQEHSRLLAQVLYGMNAELLDRHWSDAAFILVRRVSGLHAEILILLIAEIIAKRYYRALAEGVSDPVAHAIFAQIVHDEQGHVAFHIDRLHADFSPLPYPMRAAIRLGWKATFRLISLIVLFDHRAILRTVNVTPRAFLRDCNSLFDETAREIFAD